jgi:hypothetical protein
VNDNGSGQNSSSSVPPRSGTWRSDLSVEGQGVGGRWMMVSNILLPTKSDAMVAIEMHRSRSAQRFGQKRSA